MPELLIVAARAIRDYSNTNILQEGSRGLLVSILKESVVALILERIPLELPANLYAPSYNDRQSYGIAAIMDFLEC